jgi:hypothetical protein
MATTITQPKTAATVTKLPPKPADYSNGLIYPTTHDKEVSNEVLAVLVPADTLTASISGSPYLRVSAIRVFDLSLTTVDPGDLPPGHAPLGTWEEELSAEYDGSTPVHVTKGQRVHVRVALKVPEHAVPPGAVTGTLTLQGSTYSTTVALQGTYLAVADNTSIAHRWSAMGNEPFFGPVTSNAHSMPGVPGTIQEFVNGALWDTGNGVFYLAADVMAKWRSPSVQNQTTMGPYYGEFETVAAKIGPPIEDTFTTSEGGHAVHFYNDGFIVTHGALPIAPCVLYDGFPEMFNGEPSLGFPITDVLLSPDGEISYVNFQNGLAFVNQSSGPYLMVRPIRDKWTEFGGAAGVLGYPLSIGFDENLTITVVALQGGVIYSGLGIGTHEVHGPLWEQADIERFGYPISDVMPWVNPANGVSGVIINSQQGRVAWTSRDGVIYLPN